MKYSIRNIILGASSLALLTSAAHVMNGQVSPHWTGSSGNYHAGSNWSGGVAPGADDTAIFDNNAAATNYTLGFGGVNATVQNATFVPTSGTVTLNIGTGFNWNISDTLQVGNGGGANLTLLLNTGTLTADNLVVSSGATFSMNLAGTSGTTATLNTTSGSNIITTDLQIAGFQRGFTWNIQGGENTGSNNIKIAFGTGSSATVNVDGPTTSWETGAGRFDVGYNGVGALSISGGARVNSSSAHLAANNSASAGSSASVEGAGSEWNLTGTLRVGQAFGTNSLTVSEGGVVTAADARLGELGTAASNAALVTGENSAWTLAGSLTVGGAAGGNTVTIADGGTLTTGNAFGSLGRDATSGNNSVLIDGGSWQMGGELSLGNRGSSNQLSITNGGAVNSAGSIVVGSWDGATSNAAIVSGAGSQWDVAGVLTVGREGGSNTLEISNGGKVNTSHLTLSEDASALNNTADVSSGGTLNVSGFLTVGGGGTASFTLDGGNLSAGTLIVEGPGNTFTFLGGTLATSGATFDNGENFVVGNGTQSATWQIDGAHTATNGITISSNASLGGSGSITGNVNVLGALSPGNSIGSTTIEGNLSLGSGSATVMELGSAQEFDEVSVSGSLTFDGTLTVILLDGYTPGEGDTFRLFDFSTGTGAFAQLNLPALSNGLFWDTDNLYSAGDLSVIPEPGTTALWIGTATILVLLGRRKNLIRHGKAAR